MMSKTSKSTFGEELYQLRMGRRLSHQALAEVTCLSKSYLSELENLRRPPPPSGTVATIAAALKVTEAQRSLLHSLAAKDRQVISVRMPKSASVEIADIIRQIARVGPRLSQAQLRLIRDQLEVDM